MNYTIYKVDSYKTLKIPAKNKKQNKYIRQQQIKDNATQGT